MKFNLDTQLPWIPRLFSGVVIVTWLAGMIFLYGFGPYFMFGLLFWIVIVCTTIMAWKTSIFGGVMFILLGFLYLIIALGNQFSFSYIVGSAPFFITGTLFVGVELYQEKREAAKEGDF